MKGNIIVWSKDECGFCDATKDLLNSRDLSFEERNTSQGSFTVDEMKAATSGNSFPQVVVDGEVVGGFHELVIAIAKNDRAVWSK